MSKQRKHKRRTHYKASAPHVAICAETGEPHVWHKAYEHNGHLYYKGQMLVKTPGLED
jgi:large subunit ribosomal protein L32